MTARESISRRTVPRARILESFELFVNSGSSINMCCSVEPNPQPPVFVFWYRNDRMTSYDAAKGGPENISGGKRGQDAYVSSFFIRNARPHDSGNYTCGPSNADSTRVVVHVLNAVVYSWGQALGSALGSGVDLGLFYGQG
ncbi:conserved hypothetical protein [Ixodes scapularis]|uniref:Ig-like domain-containing protein n=1 Tax=Ixodes scapularis TaxID=6945 RepID=B7PV90_IXOSC|nr:conserved hypothetical protein [Ixodes scapularis]|eukprot:XP_002407543.1 conserved hypothetical protein [Ixodes scapularis]